MSFFNAIKGAIWEGDTVAPPKSDAAAPVPALNDSYVQALRVALKARPTVFTALLQAADKLLSIIPDPNTRLKAAFTTVSGEGRGVREIMAAIEIHSADLEAQRMQFNQAVEKQKTTVLGSMQSELDSLAPSTSIATQQIAAMQTQISSLNELISRNSQRQAEITGQLTAEQARFALSQQQFEMALTAVKGELDGQKAAIQSALS